jgi:pimeloyl-ACP methyl ester carboxylesterase
VPEATPLAGFEQRSLEVKAVRMRYFVGGAGPPLVLVHGLTGAAANWSELAPLLAERHRLLIPDLPGHGGSSPLPAAPNVAAYAERVWALAGAERLLPAALVGHSMGGLVALRLALRHPSDVTALVLAATAGIGSTTRRARFWLGLAGRVRPGIWVTPLRAGAEAPGLSRRVVFAPLQTSDPLSLTPRAARGFLASALLHSDVTTAVRALVGDDPRLDLAALRCPRLILWGTRDRQLPIGDGYELARRLDAPFRAIADCGHLLIGERPHACRDAVESFLSSVLRRSVEGA